MKLTLAEISDVINGNVIGDEGVVITGVSEIQNGIPGTITFLSNPMYKKYSLTTSSSAIIVKDENLLNGKHGILVSNPQVAMAKILELFYPREKKSPLIDPRAIILENAISGKEVINKKVSNNEQVDMSQLSKGIYQLSFEGKEWKEKRKIIKD